MSIARLASWVHKWLALLVGVQILFWVVSGLFFTLFPIEQIRSEHLIRHNEAQAVDASSVGDLSAIGGPNGERPMRIVIERRNGVPVAVVEYADADPELYDATTLQRLSPLSGADAAAAARAHVTLDTAPIAVERVTEETPEYRGALPAYRVRFAEGGLAVYVAENTGAVTARRSDLWRVYDALWALHIMDWRDHENFNHPLIVVAAWLTLVSVIAGVVLLPYRIRFGPRQS